MNKIIAIDYDGTITDDTPYPKEAKIRPEAIKYIRLLYEKGYILVLWTARKEAYYFECITRLKKVDLYKYFTFNYDYGILGKIKADFYIDDKSVPGKLNWKQIYKHIIKNIN